ncbi:MAG: hemerythrin domain-containing protein [Chitinophagales bacterium]
MERQLLMGYYLNHRALRKDCERLKTVSGKFDQYSKDQWAKIAAWYDYHLKLVHYHHHGEDEFFFPWIKQRSPKFAAQLQRMDEEHKALSKFMDKMKDMMSRVKSGESGLKDDFQNIATAYCNLLANHLNEEEKFVEEAIKEFKREEVFAAEDQYTKMMTREQMNLALPWMVDVMTPQEMKEFFAVTPFFVKWIYIWRAKPAFDKMVSVI